MEQLKNKANIIYCALFIYLYATSFVNQDVYAFTVRFASVVIFLVLGALSLPYLSEDIKNKDTDLILAAVTVVLSVVFVFVTGSGYGAAFIPSDLALICYMSKHIRLGARDMRVISFAGAVPVILWYSHVRWSYNFNMAGFAFMLMAFFAMILAENADIEFLSENKSFVELIIFITAFILSMLYHSRTAMFGMIMFAVIYATFYFMSTMKRSADMQKAVQRAVFLLASVGAVFFTAVYIKIAGAFDNITILYKDVFSGRQAIWRELWGAFLASPVTGTGSAYELKSFEIFEVHNGMFDILAVHGIIVFSLVVALMWRMFDRTCASGLHKADTGKAGEAQGFIKLNRTRRMALSAAFAMMFTSYFENFFTVPPYSIIFLTFILICRAEPDAE